MNIGWATMEAFDNRERGSVGSSMIRGRWILEQWHEMYPNEEVEEYVMGKKYDVLVFQKVYWDKMLDAFDGIKVIDICDPDWLEGKDVMKYIEQCDLCTTSTEQLAQYIRKFVSTKVVCVPDRVRLKEFPRRVKHEGRATKAVWFGYSQNHHYITQTLEVLAELGLKLIVISNQSFIPPSTLKLIEIENIKYSTPEVYEQISKCDFYISPERSETDEKGRFKSNNKDLISMSIGVPVVRSADNLDRLMNADERNKQMDRDWLEIQDKWDVKYSVDEFRSLINEISEQKSKRV